MSGRTISRRKLAEFVAKKLQTGEGDDALKQAAAYLMETKQKRNVELLVRDIEDVMATNGIVVADVTSARPLSKDDKSAIAELLDAKELHTRETIDPSVLGGVRVEASGRRLDATLKHKIDSLKEIDSRKGTK